MRLVLQVVVVGAAVLVIVAGGPTAPVPKDAGKLQPPTPDQWRTSAKNLRQLVIACHSYHDVNGFMPNNVYTKDGKPLLSWRVLILPYIEETPLYQEFKLDEPWDSENNKKLIARMPKVYAPIRGKAKPGETFYRGFAGKGAVFGPDKTRGLTMATITNMNGASNTGMVFEAGEPVVWTKPDDLPFDPAKPLPKLGGMFDGEFHVAFCDGAVRRLRKNPDAKELKKLIRYDNDDPFDIGKLLAR